MTGGALGQLAGVAMGLVGLISVFKARRVGRKVAPQDDARLAERMEMERRMAFYLAAQDDKTYKGASDERR